MKIMSRLMDRMQLITTTAAACICLMAISSCHHGGASILAGEANNENKKLTYISKWKCKGIGEVVVRSSDKLIHGQRYSTLTFTETSAMFPGYTEGNRDQMFIPNDKSPQSPWFYFQRSTDRKGKNAQIFFGAKQWPTGDDVGKYKSMPCS
jgi:hypothetical protein